MNSQKQSWERESYLSSFYPHEQLQQVSQHEQTNYVTQNGDDHINKKFMMPESTFGAPVDPIVCRTNFLSNDNRPIDVKGTTFLTGKIDTNYRIQKFADKAIKNY